MLPADPFLSFNNQARIRHPSVLPAHPCSHLLAMAPIAFDFSDDIGTAEAFSSANSTSGPAAAAPTVLVVGSQTAAANGSYQALVTELSANGKTDMHMYDRIVEGGQSRELLVWPTPGPR
jgi:hypothetical protein